jgi:hypothetical protein
MLNKMGKFDQFFEILFPGKRLDDELQINELIADLNKSPIFFGSKQLIENQAEIFINVGEFTNAVK